MEKIIMTLIIVILMLIVVCYIGSLVFTKNTKEFHIHFSWKEFDISGTFFNNSPQENHK